MWSLSVVLPTPSADLLARVPESGKPTDVQTFIAQPPVETLDLRILHWLAGFDVAQTQSSGPRPTLESAGSFNSGPLSNRILCALPRIAITWSSTRVTRREGNEVSTSNAKHSRE